jgi:hypothetical protein
MPLYHVENVNGKDQMVAVGNVTFPNVTSGKNYLVIVGSEGGMYFGGTALPDSTSDFPLKSVRVVNVTPLKVVATCNDKNIPLNPGQYTVAPVGVDYGVSVSIAKDGDLTQINGNVYRDTAGNRSTVFLVLTNADQLRATPDALPIIRMMAYSDNPNQDKSSSSRKKHNSSDDSQ